MSPGRRLYLLRHAKSSWDDPMLRDAERPLASRGTKAARRLRRHLAEAGVEVEAVFCSPAQRARETWEIVSGGVRVTGRTVAGGPEIHVAPPLYDAGGDDVLAFVRALPEGARRVLLVGHNPGLQDFVADIDAGAVGEKLPTGALVTIDVEGEWRDFAPAGASVVSVVRPKELPG